MNDLEARKVLREVYNTNSVSWILETIAEFMREDSSLQDPIDYENGELSDEAESQEEKIRLVAQCAQDLSDAGGW